MANDYLVSDDDYHLTFRRPLDIQVHGVVFAALLGIAVFDPFFMVSPHGPQGDLGQWFHYLVRLTLWNWNQCLTSRELPSELLYWLLLAPLFWWCLYMSSTFHLRFDLRDGTYELRDGFFPLRRTLRGTCEDIECIYIVTSWSNPRNCRMYGVRLRWKRRDWLWPRRTSRLDWTDDRWEAHQESWEFARKLGVPRADTK